VPCPKTVGDVSRRNDSRTRRVKAGKIRGICSRAVRSTSTPTPQTPFIPPLVFERDDGLFAIGWHDNAAGPFQSRLHAESVAASAGTRTAVSS
jgi:hypothetical protein